MTMCDRIRRQLTAYLDGELADDDGSVVRGHLRECAACRQIARDEAALRDGLRALEPLDPPAALWTGVQARLAAAEVADARKPRWRRHAERGLRWLRWARFNPTMHPLAAAAVVAVAAVAMVFWRAHRADDAGHVVVAAPERRGSPGGPPEGPPPGPPAASPSQASPIAQTARNTQIADDVTADLLADAARTTASHDRAIEELMKLAAEDSARWSADARAAFDARLAGLRTAIAHASPGRAAQRAQRSMIRYLQTVVVHDDVVLAAGGAP